MSNYSGFYNDYVETITYGSRVLGMNAREIWQTFADNPAAPSMTMVRYIMEKEGLWKRKKPKRSITVTLPWNTWTPEMQYKFDTL